MISNWLEVSLVAWVNRLLMGFSWVAVPIIHAMKLTGGQILWAIKML